MVKNTHLTNDIRFMNNSYTCVFLLIEFFPSKTHA